MNKCLLVLISCISGINTRTNPPHLVASFLHACIQLVSLVVETAVNEVLQLDCLELRWTFLTVHRSCRLSIILYTILHYIQSNKSTCRSACAQDPCQPLARVNAGIIRLFHPFFFYMYPGVLSSAYSHLYTIVRHPCLYYHGQHRAPKRSHPGGSGTTPHFRCQLLPEAIFRP